MLCSDTANHPETDSHDGRQAHRIAKLMIEQLSHDEWRLTYQVTKDTTLRLRIIRTPVWSWDMSACEPVDQVLCEVADPSNDFRIVGSVICAVPHGETNLDLWPREWRHEFFGLSQVWATCTELPEWFMGFPRNPTGASRRPREGVRSGRHDG